MYRFTKRSRSIPRDHPIPSLLVSDQYRYVFLKFTLSGNAGDLKSRPAGSERPLIEREVTPCEFRFGWLNILLKIEVVEHTPCIVR